MFNLQFSAQIQDTGGGGSGTDINIWLRKNGVDVTESDTKVSITNASKYYVAAWNWVLSMNAGDYLEIMWATNNTAIQLVALPASGGQPSIPSVIATMTQVTYTQSGYSGASGYSGFSGYSGWSGYSGATPSTMTVTTDSTTNPSYLTFVAGTSGSQAVHVNTGLTYDAATNAITGGVAGGTF